MLNMGRVLATLYPALKAAGQEFYMAEQQLFYYVLETEAQLLRERKKRSIPGAAVDLGNSLFNSEDLARDKKVWQVNQAGVRAFLNVRNELNSYFPNPAGSKSFKFKGWAGHGRGKAQASTNWRGRWNITSGYTSGFRGRSKGQGKWPARRSVQRTGDPSYGSNGDQAEEGYGSPEASCSAPSQPPFATAFVSKFFFEKEEAWGDTPLRLRSPLCLDWWKANAPP